MHNPVLEAVTARRSVRRFRSDPVSVEAIETVLDAGRWAPSGLNNQPWRFHIVRSAEAREAVARCTVYGDLLRNAPAAVAVFLDARSSYHREKDIQAVGAAIQNILLAAHSLGLGACWIGEILNHRAEAEAALGAAGHLELMAVVALGHPDPSEAGEAERLPLDELIVAKI